MSTIGFRRWRVSGSGDLVGLAVRHVWTPGPQTAQCRGIDGLGFGNCAPARAWPGHESPSFRSRCGIWAHKQPVRECQCGHPGTAAHGAVGAVRMWGRFVEHETGWRAEHAQLVALVDYTGRVNPKYEAPRYPDLASLYGEWASDEEGWAPGEATVWCHPDPWLAGAAFVWPPPVRLRADLQQTVGRMAAAVRAEVKPLVDWLATALRDDPNEPPRDPPPNDQA